MDLKDLMRSVERSSKESLKNMWETVTDGVYDAIQLSRKELEIQLDVENFTKNIVTIPEKIRIQQEVLKEARTAFESAKSNIVNAESMLMSIITAETNEAGKPLYSNDKARQAELEIRKKMDWEYREAWEPYKAALDEMENAQFLLEQLQNEFKAYQVVGNVLAARMSLMRLEV
ncbi:MAG: hypothetical protein AB7E31_14660 [Desulfitobacterium sp.]